MILLESSENYIFVEKKAQNLLDRPERMFYN